MIGFDHAFRNLLLKRIRKLNNEKLLAYEGLVALELELIQSWEILQFERGYEQYLNEPKKDKQTRLEKQIATAHDRAQNIFKDFKDEFNALHELWIARRRLALLQGNYFQIPFGGGKLGGYLKTWRDYRLVQAQTAWTFLCIRMKKSWGAALEKLWAAIKKPFGSRKTRTDNKIGK